MRLTRKKLTVIFSVVMLFMATSCGSSSVSTTTSGTEASMDSFDGNYYKMINTGRGTNSENFYLEFSNTQDLVTIGSGLQILSTSHFSTSSYYLAEGQQLTMTDYDNLKKRDAAGTPTKKKKYPYTLQVAHGTTLDGTKDPVMVANLTEQDYYVKSGSKYTLKGISIAIVLDPTTADGSQYVTMSSSTIKSFSQTVIEKMYKYIRQKKSKLKDLPALITVYQANDSDVSEINGNFIYQSYCEDGNVGTMKSVNHENVIFTSDRAEKLDPTTYSEFTTIKSALKKASTEAAGLVGEASYIDNTIQSMKITAHLNIKTYTEMLYLTSVLADRIDSKFTQDFSVRALVYSQDELMAVIVKAKGEDAKTTIIEQ